MPYDRLGESKEPESSYACFCAILCAMIIIFPAAGLFLSTHRLDKVNPVVWIFASVILILLTIVVCTIASSDDEDRKRIVHSLPTTSPRVLSPSGESSRLCESTPLKKIVYNHRTPIPRSPSRTPSVEEDESEREGTLRREVNMAYPIPQYQYYYQHRASVRHEEWPFQERNWQPETFSTSNRLEEDSGVSKIYWEYEKPSFFHLVSQ